MEIRNRKLHRVTSTAIIHKDGKYLLVQRTFNKKAFPGKWTVPGGGLEVDDYINLPASGAGQWYNTIESSLRREIKEEAGLEVGKLNYLVDIAFIRPDGVPVVILSYWTDYKSGKVELDEDNVEHAWVTVKEAENYDLIEGILEEIKMVDKIIKGVDSNKVEFDNQ